MLWKSSNMHICYFIKFILQTTSISVSQMKSSESVSEFTSRTVQAKHCFRQLVFSSAKCKVFRAYLWPGPSHPSVSSKSAYFTITLLHRQITPSTHPRSARYLAVTMMEFLTRSSDTKSGNVSREVAGATCSRSRPITIKRPEGPFVLSSQCCAGRIQYSFSQSRQLI